MNITMFPLRSVFAFRDSFTGSEIRDNSLLVPHRKFYLRPGEVCFDFNFSRNTVGDKTL
jgi:hypothetical protein